MLQLLAYGVTFAVLLVCDFIWLGFVAKDIYRDAIGHLMAPSVNIPAAAAFYLLYPLGLLIFAVWPQLSGGDWQKAALYGGLFGLFCYGTYDLSNLATLRDYPAKIAVIDMVWGGAVSAFAAGLAAMAARAAA